MPLAKPDDKLTYAFSVSDWGAIYGSVSATKKQLQRHLHRTEAIPPLERRHLIDEIDRLDRIEKHLFQITSTPVLPPTRN